MRADWPASASWAYIGLHGRSDRMVNVIHAYHTDELIPAAELQVFDDLGHFSITTKVVPAIRKLLRRWQHAGMPVIPATTQRTLVGKIATAHHLRHDSAFALLRTGSPRRA